MQFRMFVVVLVLLMGCLVAFDSTSEPGQAETPPAVDPGVDVVDGWACFVDGDGEIDCAGQLREEFGDPPAEGTYHRLSISSTHGCALETAGVARCWGRDDVEEVAPPEDEAFEDIAVVDDSTCAVYDDRGLRCWGEAGDWHDWEEVDDPFESVAATTDYVCGVDAEGRADCWGEEAISVDDDRQAEDAETDEDDLEIGRGTGGAGLREEPTTDDSSYGRVGGLGEEDDDEDEELEGAVEIDGPDVNDFCEASHVRAILEARSDGLTHCYERELPNDAELEGEVSLHWRIELDGSASAVMVAESTLDHSPTEDCLVRIVQRMNFDNPDGGMCDVTAPLEFYSVESAAASD